ncbi:hypothetical protein AGMMS50276_00320 [Synergistales bacterium]|nr:hypothetical protein AGMMS50276_00320 [Synergistales bacterium]
MLNKIIKITLKSDLCPASGDGFAGYVDTDVCFEDNGLPYIPGKRLKGCLRECGLDILSVDESYSSVFDELFGSLGKLTPGELTIGNGRLEDYANIAKSITAGIHRSEIAEVYTSVRSRTKMESGKAVHGSLRTMRVLNRGEKFEFPITVPDDEDALDFLEKCVRSLRGFGLNRSRGLGEVVCELTGNTQAKGVTFEKAADYSGEKAFSYILTLNTPVISAERGGKMFKCEDYIFGSAILGAFAAKYAKKYNLDPEKAYCPDADFRHIFLDGAVKFTAALPFKDGQVYTPAPNSLKTNKIKKRLSDESDGIPKEKDEENPICKRLGGYIAIDGDAAVKRFKPEKTVFLHHARPHDKSIAHATGKNGDFYSYEALSEGQQFAGSVIGDERDLKKLAALFDDSADVKIGRSRTAQYGSAKIESAAVVAPQPLGLQKDSEFNKFRLVVITPLILEDENGVNTTDLDVVAKTLGSDIKITGKFCAETTVAGYYGKWLLARQQLRAIAEGSVIVFEYGGSGAEVSDGFMGLRNGEGFGQYRVEWVPRADKFKPFEPDENQDKQEKLISGETCNSPLCEKIKKLRAGKQAVASGAEYGEMLHDKKAPKNAGLARIIAGIGASRDFGGFAKKLVDIKQPEQKVKALAFVTNKSANENYFKTDAEHLNVDHIEKLLKNESGDYEMFRKHLTAAVTRIKQKRREQSKGGRE